MGKRGRKPQPNAKRESITTRFNEQEFRAVGQYAKSKGTPVRTLIRDVILEHLSANGHPTNVEAVNPNQLIID